MTDDPRYHSLRSSLDLIYDQVAVGKGEIRHGDDEPFEKQQMCTGGRIHGIGFLTGQIEKKSREVHRILALDGPEAALREAISIGGYAAGLILLMKEQTRKEKG